MGFDSPDYELARQDLRQQFQPQFSRMEKTYGVAESLFRAKGITISKPRGLNEGTVTVIFLLLTKACKTFRAIRAVDLEGCGQDAAILLRALFETTTAVLWILQRNSRHRARLYAAHEDQRRLVLVQEQAKTPGLKRGAKPILGKAQERVDKWRSLVGTKELQSVRRHWSGEPSLEAAVRRLKGWLVAYNTVYRGTSSFAHGSDPTQHANFHSDVGTPVYKLLPGVDEVDRTTTVACALLYVILKRMNERMGSGLDDSLDSIKPERLKKVPSNSHTVDTSASNTPATEVAADAGQMTKQ